MRWLVLVNLICPAFVSVITVVAVIQFLMAWLVGLMQIFWLCVGILRRDCVSLVQLSLRLSVPANRVNAWLI